MRLFNINGRPKKHSSISFLSNITRKLLVKKQNQMKITTSLPSFFCIPQKILREEPRMFNLYEELVYNY